MRQNVLELQSSGREGPDVPVRAARGPVTAGRDRHPLPGPGPKFAPPAALPWRNALWFSVAFVACAELGHALSAQGVPQANFWLPAGLYVAVLLLHETKAWPWLVLAALPANLLCGWFRGGPSVHGLFFYGANTIEAVTGAWLVRRFVASRPTLTTLREFLGLVGCSAVVASMAGAVVGAAGLVAAGRSHSFLASWKTWWASEAMAVLLVAPFVLAWFSRPGSWWQAVKRARPHRWLEAALLVAGLAGGIWYMMVMDQGILAPYKSRLLLFILWAGVRFGPRGATAANLLLALAMAFLTVHYQRGLTPAQFLAGDHVLILQSYLVIAAIVGLIPAIALAERDRKVVELRESQERFLHLSTAAFEGIIISERGRILDANDQALHLFGYTRDEMIGRAILEVVSPESRSLVSAAIQAGREEAYEHALIRKDGTHFLAEAQAKMVHLGDRAVRMTALRDVTGRRRAEAALRENQAKLVMAMDMVKLGHWEFDATTGWFTFDDNFYKLFGTTAAREGGPLMTAADYSRRFIPPGEAAIVVEEIRLALETTDPNYTRQMEHRFNRADGSSGVMLVRFAIVKDAAGRTVKTYGVNQDITEQKLTQQALAAGEALLRQFITHAPAAIAMLDTEMRYLQASDRWLTDYNLTGHDLIGRSHYEVFPDIQERWKEIHRRVLAGAIERCDEDPFPRADGTQEWLQWEVRPWRKVDGTIGGLIMFTQVISERKLMEETLRCSEERFRSAILHSPIGISLVASDGRWLEVNPALCAIVGYTRVELLATENFKAITHPDDLPADLACVSQLLARQTESYQLEKRYLHQEGRSVWVQLNVSVVWNPDDTPRYFVAQIQDITRRKAAEKALAEHQARLVLAMDMALLAHWEYDVATNRFTGDENLFRLYGTSLAQEGGRAMLMDDFVRRFLAPEEASLVGRELAAALATADPNYTRQFEMPIIRADGAARVMINRFVIEKDAAGRTVKAYGANQDITEQKKMEQQRRDLEGQLRQAQKLEAIGTLAGGIAHDFNNILAGIMGNLQLAEMELPGDHPVQAFVQEADRASRRARDLVARILTFSRRREQKREAAGLAPVIAEALRLLRATLPATIKVSTEFAADCPPVLCDITQIHQVVMNLGVNAAAAMREQGGLLEVRLHHGAPEQGLRERHPHVGAQHTVHLAVRDTGCGIPAGVIDRIFDPFFTTKRADGGTGLGLAMVHGIMKSHGGAIVVESTPGTGTTFHLFFPAAGALGSAGPAEARGPGLPVSSPALRGRGERILVVDDEQMVLNVAARALRHHGYQPAIFPRAADALAAFAREPDAYAALVTDLTMPEMTGLELARQILVLKPGLPVVIASGHLHDEALAEARSIAVTHFVRKPYDLVSLVAELGTVLRQAEPART